MFAGIDIVSNWPFIVGAIVVFFLIDLYLAGGSMTGGVASGVCGMMGGLAGGMAGIWWLLVPLLVAAAGLLLFAAGPASLVRALASGSSDLLLIVLAVPVVVILVMVALIVLSSRTTSGSPLALAPEDILRRRYANGEIGRQQYIDTLVDILKDRCLRGELDINDYEKQLGFLLQEPTRATIKSDEKAK